MSEANKNILDLNPIFGGDKNAVDFGFDFMPELFDGGDVLLKSPIHAEVKVYEKAAASHGSESLVMADFSLTGEYTVHCARCLKELSVPVSYSASYAVAGELQNENDEGDSVLLASGGMLDAGEYADSLFFMNLPSKHLCSEDCKGLCPGCGKNLNIEKCACTAKNIDPRLAVLKKLLDKQEN